MSLETLARLDNIGRMVAEGAKRDALYKPLVQFLMPKWLAAQRCGVFETGEMSIHLPVAAWRKQHEAGIDMCCGFRIEYWH